MKGKHTIRVRKEIGDGWIQAGTRANPQFIRKSRIHSYVTDEWWRIFRVWHRYHIGMGLPNARNWGDESAVIVGIIELYETIWRNWGIENGDK